MNPGLPEEQIFPVAPTAKGGAPVTIGRTKDNQIFCLHKSLSRKHARIEFDGRRVTVTDLQSKNGVFHNGRRVARCEVSEGDTFRCGDITFLVEGATFRSPATKLVPVGRDDRAVATLPSPMAKLPDFGHTKVSSGNDGDRNNYKDKLFLLIRASELCVSELSIDRVLEELVTLAVQAITVDRCALLALDDQTLDMHPRVVKSFTHSTRYPYSQRVVDFVVDHGSPASFADVSRDRRLPGDAARDADVRAAMCVPINPGGGTIGVIYVDSLSHSELYKPDDLALLRAIANHAAVAIEGAALRGGEARGRSLVPSMPRPPR
ncbi:MAG: FHA domain-containing protein [Labilithrix sp.]|nr:FHA domain-containing protein [Labilithrix sp.]MCW5818200.1 FHA domain-containing protein [Labilithrix sp.]